MATSPPQASQVEQVEQVEQSAQLLPPQAGRFEGLTAFRQALRGLLDEAAARGWQELILCDPDFADWPLGEAAVVASLQTWARSGGRRMTLLASDYRLLQGRHARFVAWRCTWDHLLQCRVLPSRGQIGTSVPSALWSPDWVLQRTALDEQCAGLCSTERAFSLKLRSGLDECLTLSAPAFAASVLGL